MAGKQEDLEVMGVSRSGRVRKKSSKLLDFESPEEVETRLKKQQSTPKAGKAKSPKAAVVPPLVISLPKKNQVKEHSFAFSEDDSDRFSESVVKEDYFDNDFDQNIEAAHEFSENDDGHMKAEYEAESDFPDEDGDEILNDFSDCDTDLIDVGGSAGKDSSLQMQSSLYMLEKSKKKQVSKNGKLTATRQKTQRKDKGKTRFTAYMLWAKEMRPTVSRQHPEMGFVAVSKRLGELWSNVSKTERLSWKNRALRLANRAAGGMISTGVTKTSTASSAATTTITTSATKPKTTVSPKRTSTARPAAAASSPAKTNKNSGTSTTSQQLQMLTSSDAFDNFAGSESYESILSLSSSTLNIPSGNRAGEMEPLDVACHLHLLGESLSVIGSRLKEHEGQIAVSGSLSVLLDSVLCALGPLMCLTRLCPETDGCPPETLSRILDNIAYIMPGL